MVPSPRGVSPCPHLDHMVQGFVEQVHELGADVEQVDLAPGDHDAGQGPLIRASTLQRRARTNNPKKHNPGPSWHLWHSPSWDYPLGDVLLAQHELPRPTFIQKNDVESL